MEKKLSVAMFGQKRLSREGGVEIVVKELCTRMAKAGHKVTCYNRSGHHVSGAEYDRKTEYTGVRQRSVPTIEKKGLAAVSSSFFAALCSAFFIFLLTPTFKSVKIAAGGLIVAIAMKTIALSGGGYGVYAVSTVLSNEIWFVLGMSICAFNVQLKGRKVQGTICGLLFMILSVMVYKAEISGSVIPFVMGLLACVAVILMVAGGERTFGRGMDFLAKYTMPIYLMHTLFAAPMRSVLLKLGIGSSVIHVVLGLGISFVGPIIAAWIMKKTKWLEFFLYPNKFVKIRN